MTVRVASLARVSRVVLGLVCVVALTGCASATAFRVKRADVSGPCQTAVPDRDVLFGVALSGGGSRAALFGEAGLEALARLQTADGASVLDKINHVSSVSGGKHRGGVLRPEEAGPRRESAEPGRHLVGRVPDLLRDLPHRGQSGLRDQPDLAPALVVPLDQLGPGRQDPRRAPRRAALRETLFFQSLQIEGVFPDAKTITVVPLRHTEAKWAADMSDLPPACKAEAKPLATPEEVTERIAEIPTRLVLNSECDRQLLSAAAFKLVDEHRDRILEFLNRP